MQLFQNAALEIIKNEGVEKLKVNKLERKVGKSKRLLYDYFGGIDGLLKQVLRENDPWLTYKKNLNGIIELHKSNKGVDLPAIILKNHFVHFFHDSLAQQISLLELTKHGDELLYDLSNSREQ